MRIRFGSFIAPFHPPEHNPTLSLEADLELIEHLDKLGFDEAWIDEHHSAGSEIIGKKSIAVEEATEHYRTERVA